MRALLRLYSGSINTVMFDTGSSVLDVLWQCMAQSIAVDIGLPGIVCDFGQVKQKALYLGSFKAL